MALVIRCERTGRKNLPHFRIVVKEKRSPRDGKSLERLGLYDPLKTENNFSVNKERIQYWISKGAKPSETVLSFLKKAAA